MESQNSIVGDVVTGIIRHAITTLAGGFVAQGLINQNQVQTLVAGVMVLVGVGWSIYSKGQAAQKLAGN
jgi:hypothetical protein